MAQPSQAVRDNDSAGVVASLTRRHEVVAPFDRWEERLVRDSLARPGVIHPRDEAALRYAMALARLVVLRTPAGDDLTVAEYTQEIRDKLAEMLAPAFARDRVDEALVARAALPASKLARAARAKLVVRLGSKMSPEDIERELTQKALVLACGGGGGVGYVHLGAFALLESAGIRPKLIAGSSMGAVMGLFRARALRFEVSQVPKIMGELETRRLFRPFGGENRWTLPSPVRLALREGIGPYFEYDGVPMRLRDLPIPLLVTVAGVRRASFPYWLLDTKTLTGQLSALGSPLRPDSIRRIVTQVLKTMAALVRSPGILRNVVLGANDATREFDAVDAVGFSSSVPGALHYDLVREAPADVARIQALFKEHDLFRVTDGGVVDNVPARTAWRAVQRGLIGTRNVFVVALDGFSPRLSTPLWLPIQRIARENVKRSLPYSHLYMPFRRTLSPVELLPHAPTVMRSVESAKAEMIVHLPYIQRMLEPLPGVAALLSG